MSAQPYTVRGIAGLHVGLTVWSIGRGDTVHITIDDAAPGSVRTWIDSEEPHFVGPKGFTYTNTEGGGDVRVNAWLEIPGGTG